MNLLIDIGNSRAKWAVETAAGLGEIKSFDYRRPDFLHTLTQLWREISVPNQIAIASVADKMILTGVTDLCAHLWSNTNVIIAKSSAYAFGVRSAYEAPEKLGVDRWMALLAAHRYYAGNVCIVDCGTAITIDALQANGKHLGGLICPGLTMMQQSLVAGIASLPSGAQCYRTGLATQTSAAIGNGVYWAALGLINQVMQSFSDSYRLLLTGGDAEIIAESLSIPYVLDKELVLKGLALFCRGA